MNIRTPMNICINLQYIINCQIFNQVSRFYLDKQIFNYLYPPISRQFRMQIKDQLKENIKI